MNETSPTSSGFQQVYEQVKAILQDARAQAYRAINTAMVTAYWEIGRVIVEEEQEGRERAEYGKALLAELSRRLTTHFGRGYDRTNLRRMRAFYLSYPIRDALRLELSWTHYRLLLRVDSSEARAFYEAETVNARWSTRELERQIQSLLFEQSCDTHCPRTTSRYLPRGTSSICPQNRNWQQNCSASGRLSKWKGVSAEGQTRT